jgi:hypothetical protein
VLLFGLRVLNRPSPSYEPLSAPLDVDPLDRGFERSHSLDAKAQKAMPLPSLLVSTLS